MLINHCFTYVCILLSDKNTQISMTTTLSCNISNGCTGYYGKTSLITLRIWQDIALNEGRVQNRIRIVIRFGQIRIRLLYKKTRLDSFQSSCRSGKAEKLLNSDFNTCGESFNAIIHLCAEVVSGTLGNSGMC